MPSDDQLQLAKAVLAKRKPLTRNDLQILRENSEIASSLSSRSDWFTLRIEVELIDAITALNKSTTFLARVGIAVAIVGVLVGTVGLITR